MYQIVLGMSLALLIMATPNYPVSISEVVVRQGKKIAGNKTNWILHIVRKMLELLPAQSRWYCGVGPM